MMYSFRSPQKWPFAKYGRLSGYLVESFYIIIELNPTTNYPCPYLESGHFWNGGSNSLSGRYSIPFSFQLGHYKFRIGQTWFFLRLSCIVYYYYITCSLMLLVKAPVIHIHSLNMFPCILTVYRKPHVKRLYLQIGKYWLLQFYNNFARTFVRQNLFFLAVLPKPREKINFVKQMCEQSSWRTT